MDIRSTLFSMFTLSALVALGGCKSSSDVEPEEPEESTGEAPAVAADEAPVIPRMDHVAECETLLTRAQAEAETAIVAIAGSAPEELEELYRGAAGTFRERCPTMSEEALGCVRAVDTVLFGMLACETNVGRPEDEQIELPPIYPYVDGVGSTDASDADRARAARALRGSWRAADDTVWSFGADDELTIAGASEETLTFSVTSSVRMRLETQAGDTSWTAAFLVVGDELFTSDNLNYRGAALEDREKFVLRSGFDHVLYDASADVPCTVLDATGARSEAECTFSDEPAGEELRVRYRFPSSDRPASEGEVEDVSFRVRGDFAAHGEMTRWVREPTAP